jgi:hypothetical protein
MKYRIKDTEKKQEKEAVKCADKKHGAGEDKSIGAGG